MIDILLACYNGEKYIDTQIASIVLQDFKDWTLYIHDDGSTDKTEAIIREWARRERRITVIDDDEKHLGPGENFMHLLRYSDAEYVCFCDQDDYWFENKLSTQYEAIRDSGQEAPVLALSEAWAWRYPGNGIGRILKSHEPHGLDDFLFCNGGLQGCGSIFNTKMREYMLAGFKNVWMHDHIMALIALTFGKVIYIDRKLMLYRQHESNATPLSHSSRMAQIKTVLMRNSGVPVVYEPSYRDTEEFYRIFGELMPLRDRTLLARYLSYPGMSKAQRFFDICFSKFKLGNSRLKLLIKLLFRKEYIGGA